MQPKPTDPPGGAGEAELGELDATLLELIGACSFELQRGMQEVVLGAEAAVRLLGDAAQTRWERDALFNRLLPHESREAVLRMLRQTGLDGAPRSLEHAARGPRGAERWFRTAVTRTPAGTLRCLLLDVSETHRQHALWRELELWLSALCEALPFDVWICDRHERLVLMSPSFATRWEASPGQRFSQLPLPPELTLSWRQSRARALQGERSHEQLELPGPDRTRHFSRTVSPVHDGETIQGVLGVDVDITELRDAEHQVRQSLLDIAQAQQELVRREHVAALGELAAVVAHEVRHPLGAICNAISLLRRSDIDAGPQGQLLAVLEEESFRLELLVRHMLELARPHRPELRQQPLGPIVKSVLEEVLAEAEADIRVEVSDFVERAAPSLELDAERFSLALSNVVRNAQQAMPHGGSLIIDGRLVSEGDRRYAALSIRDTGEGVPERIRHRLFEPFFTTRPSGAGMGLVVARRVLTEHGGRFELQSSESSGTTVTLLLPLPRPEDARDAHPD